MKKPLIALALLTAALLAACGTETVEVEVTREVEVEVTRIVEVEIETIREVEVPIEIEVTRIVKIEAIADAPEPAPAPSGTAFDPKQKGVYLAGVDMAPGIWRSSGTPDSDGDCRLIVYDLGGSLETASIKPVGVSHRIPAGDFQITISEYGGDQCVWTYLSE